MSIHPSMIRVILCAAAALFVCSAAGSVEAFGQGAPPPGSYRNSCSNYYVKDTTLHAVCKRKNENVQGTSLQNYFFCSQDIANLDGLLRCGCNGPNGNCAPEYNSGNPSYKAAVAAFTQMHPIVLGEPVKNVLSWVEYIHRDPSGALQQRYRSGMKGEDAAFVMKKRIVETPLLRQQLVDNAFYAVYGAKSSPQQLAQWEPQVKNGATNYTQMVMTLSGELNKKPADRRTVIQTVYVLTMGRFATDGDLNYWTPKSENFQQMMIAARKFLYSPAGANDRAETVRRAVEKKLGRKPTDDEVKKAMTSYTAGEKIFSEMIGMQKGF